MCVTDYDLIRMAKAADADDDDLIDCPEIRSYDVGFGNLNIYSAELHNVVKYRAVLRKAKNVPHQWKSVQFCNES